MQLMSVLVALLVLTCTVGAMCDCNEDALIWLKGTNITFTSPDSGSIVYNGHVVDTYYTMLLIQYENGERHMVNYAMVRELLDLPSGV